MSGGLIHLDQKKGDLRLMIITNDNADTIGLADLTYHPAIPFRYGHFATMYPFGFRKLPTPAYSRERWDTIDGDFIDMDSIRKPGSTQAYLLLHGLEGSSSSQYIKGIVNHLKSSDSDIWAINHRSCSGEINRTLTLYHSGFIDDISMVIDRLCKLYDSVHVVGYSLGGNMILKYLGTVSPPSQLKSAAAISVPLDLYSSALRLKHWSNKAYSIQFLLTLNKKIALKAGQFPDIIRAADYNNISTLWEYDDKVTAPLHGFEDATDYYTRASSRPTLHKINIPTLLINALDDPFLAPPCFPYEIADSHPYFHMIAPENGGHVGFGNFSPQNYWSDRVIGQWLSGN